MHNILIVFATREGQSEKIARRLAATVGGLGERVDVANADEKHRIEVSRFDAVIVVAPVHIGKYPASIVRFVHAAAAELAVRPSAFCSVSLAVASRTTDGRAETRPIVEKFLKGAGWQPARVEMFAGALKYSVYGWLTKLIMRRIAKAAGGDTDTSKDYEYTDWAAVDRFAREFAAELGPTRATSLRNAS